MKKLKTDVLVIGGGAAGMAAAIGAAREGARVVLIEREDRTGGVLNQCIHNGFGLKFYEEELTGPEFAARLEDEMRQGNIDIISQAYLRDVDLDDKIAYILSPEDAFIVKSKAIVISTGARERPFGSLMVPGDRPAGIFTAGTAQRFVNLENRLPGERALILGSGDIGLIMARRLFLEGMEVVGVVERLPYPGGLTRNVVQCLEDFGIPLYLSATVTRVKGFPRLEAVEVMKVDENLNPIPGTEKWYNVDTLVLSAGLLPQVEDFSDRLMVDRINKGFLVSNTCEATKPGIFAAGNNVAVFDLVDYVAAEGWIAGRHAALTAQEKRQNHRQFPVVRGRNVGVLVPGRVSLEENLRVYIRLKKPMESGTVVLKELGIESPFKYGVPSEMLQLVVNKDKLSAVEDHEKLTVEVIE